ncbi:hypothetical protein FHS82_002091 [Pseudochelatococcus lubricantis]|uniref:Uncharacterized protein n=1 Tax=Pseudochelatococcus lubricantis TaxID=1538102 RepID=A0ABX0UZ73_9HYPH|nr:hypothetical protein [Pseudochelatococcus lubricantis]NIJ58249.1 hypothetical protein [Pseudochelatococcus lubricantis]
MSETTRTKTFRAQGDTGVVYTVVETHTGSEAGETQVTYALSDGRAVEKIGAEQFEIIETRELMTWI